MRYTEEIYIPVSRDSFNEDYFLGKFGKKVGNVVKDVGKLSIAPVKKAVQSVTGKKDNTTYSTKLGKSIAKVHDTGSDALYSTAKAFGDTVTGGYATKAANLLRSDENKETAFGYNEMKSGGTLAKVGAGVGAVGGVYSLASGAKSLKDAAKKVEKPAKQLYNQGIVPGDNDKNITDQTLDEIVNKKPDKGELNKLINGEEYTDEPWLGHGDNVSKAGVFDFSDPLWLGVIVGIILLIMLMK